MKQSNPIPDDLSLKNTDHAHYMPTLDGVRGAACLIVVASHLDYTLKLGWMKDPSAVGSSGVLIFFALSGFLMSMLYFGRPCNYDSAMKYFVSRFSRITPAYYIAITAVWLIYLMIPDFEFQMEPVMLARSYAFMGSAGVFWSIPPEIQFYCFFFLIWLSYERYKEGNPWWLSGVAVLSVVFIATKSYWPGISLPSKYHIFFFGFLTAVLIRRPGVRKYASWPVTQIILVLGAVVYFNVFIVYENIYEDLLYPAIIALAVMSMSATTYFSWFFQTSFMRMIGNASFSIYLIHHPIIQLIHRFYLPNGQSMVLNVAIIAFICMVIPVIFYFTVERHLNKWVKGKGLSAAALFKRRHLQESTRAR